MGYQQGATRNVSISFVSLVSQPSLAPSLAPWPWPTGGLRQCGRGADVLPALAASSCACIQWSSWLGHLEMARHIHPASFPWDLARKKLRKSSHFPSSEWRDFPNFQRSFGHLLSFFRGLDHAVLCLVGSHGHVPSSLGQQILVAFDQLRCRRGLVQQWDVLLGCITGYTSEIAILTRNSRKSTIKIWGPVVQYPFFRLLWNFWTCKIWLVVWNIFYFSTIYIYIWNVIIPTDFHIFQRGSNHQPGMVASLGETWDVVKGASLQCFSRLCRQWLQWSTTSSPLMLVWVPSGKLT